ncbi:MULTISPECIES: hypothetical protein [Sphingobium]|uniref:hypothetical protein n=1 Tax=Sphingobium TaxID=165695 RepID=UPI00159C4330|nr:hypothetical protein [Sphingobium sp. 15-1]
MTMKKVRHQLFLPKPLSDRLGALTDTLGLFIEMVRVLKAPDVRLQRRFVVPLIEHPLIDPHDRVLGLSDKISFINQIML